MKRRYIYGIVILLVILSAAVFASAYIATPGNPEFRARSLSVARDFVENSATYAFDGSGLEQSGEFYIDSRACSGCYAFMFDFTSSHAGYGDRTDEVVAQVLTEHTAHVFVVGGNVLSGILDGRWDMIRQEGYAVIA